MGTANTDSDGSSQLAPFFVVSPGVECPGVECPDVECPPATDIDSPSECLGVGRRFIKSMQASDDKQTLLVAMVDIVVECLAPVATFYHACDSSGCTLIGKQLQGALDDISSTRDKLTALCGAACAQGHLVSNPLDDGRDLVAVAQPVHVPRQRPESITLIVSTRDLSEERVAGLLGLAAAHITMWHMRQSAEAAEWEAQSTAASQELLEKLEASVTLRRACKSLSEQLQEYVGCRQVAVALCSRWNGRSRLRSISGVETFDRHTPLVTAIESALDEAILRDELTVWPPKKPGDRRAALAHHKLCNVTESQSVVSSPLKNTDGEAIGAWLFLGTKQCLDRPELLTFIRASGSRVASSLSLLRRVERGPLVTWCRSLFQGGLAWKKSTVLLAIIALVCLLTLPATYKIRCDCRVEPVSRRFVAAPYDGILERALVGSGATAVEGDELARMDGRELRWELATVTAERDRAVKQRDSAFAKHKFAAAEVAKLEVERLELKIQMLAQRQENLLIKSPIDGIVTFGDLEKAEGTPVKCGQTLFEIAPLNAMVVEVAIPEREVRYVRVGQSVTIALEACPNARYEARIQKISPRAEIRDQKNVFIAKVMLTNRDGELRPGMHGIVRIQGPRNPLAWNLFHKAWESLCLMLGW